MRKKIILKIEYSHDDTCRVFDTHDNWDCSCGCGDTENEEYVLSLEINL